MPAQMKRLESILTVVSTLRVRTGLHIGATESGIMIGGSDNPVVRDPLTGVPYVPGSSLKGKMRSLLERRYGLTPNFPPRSSVRVHACQPPGDNFDACPVCPIFGVPAPRTSSWFTVTRIGVADSFLSERSRLQLHQLRTDLPYTEIKSEVTIDRVTSAANPRNMERVPAGAEFWPVTISLQRYEGDGFDFATRVIEGMSLLEADYLGGGGSRGSGRVEFRDVVLTQMKFPPTVATFKRQFDRPLASLANVQSELPAIETWLGGD